MLKQTRLLYLASLSSILLPYGFVQAGTVVMTTNQIWFFPLWTYLNVFGDFGNWLGFGVIIPPFIPSFPLLPSIMGICWFGLGLYASRSLHQCYLGQRGEKSVLILALSLSLLQSIVTTVVSAIVWGNFLDVVIPVPLYFLFVIFLLWSQIHRVQQKDTE